MTVFKEIYKGYEFDIKADGKITRKTFEKFADESIRYMEQGQLIYYSPVGVFHDYGMIVGSVKKLTEYDIEES